MSPKIVTNYIHPPVPPRQFDWLAMYDCDDGDSPRKGYGATEQEAINDLLTNYEHEEGIQMTDITLLQELARDPRVVEIHSTDDELRIVLEIDDDEECSAE
jgi:hypothetical protein